MKIARVKATLHRIPAELPMEPSGHAPLTPQVLVRVETDEGLVGFSAAPGSPYGQLLRDFINHDLAPKLQGQDPLDTERVRRDLVGNFKVMGRSGFGAAGMASLALSAVDIALWDIRGKAWGQPVYRLLGGVSNSVPAYMTFGFIQYDREALVQVARMLVEEEGYDRLLIMLGRPRDGVDGGIEGIKDDAERVHLVREAVGEGVQLMIDGDLRFDYPRALELARRVEECDITWFEEPVVRNDIGQLKRLRQTTRIPIAAGQFEGSKERHWELVQAEAVDYLHATVHYMGGFTEALKVAHLAQACGLPFGGSGGWPHSMHLMAGVGAWGVEVHWRGFRAAETMFREVPRQEGGKITVPERPGLGLEPNEEALKEYLAE